MEQPRRLVLTRHRSRFHTDMCGVAACQTLRYYFYCQRSSVIACMRRTELFVIGFRGRDGCGRSSGSGACKRRLPNQALHNSMARHNHAAKNIVARKGKYTNEGNRKRRREAEVKAELRIYKTKDSGRQLTADPDPYRNITSKQKHHHHIIPSHYMHIGNHMGLF